MGMKPGDASKPRSTAPKPPPKPKKRAPPPPPEKEKKLWAYLAALSAGARHSEAAVTAGIPFGEVRREFSRNQDYRAAYKKAEADREELWMEQRYDDAHNRATVGVKRSVTCGSGICGEDLIPSDRLMELLLKKDHPDWFKTETKADITITGNPWMDIVQHIEGGPAPAKPE